MSPATTRAVAASLETAWEAGYRYAIRAWSMTLDDTDSLVELEPCDIAWRDDDVQSMLTCATALESVLEGK